MSASAAMSRNVLRFHDGAVWNTAMKDTRRHAIDRMVENARAMGANAVVMVRFDSSEMSQTMTEVVAYGTAAVIEKSST